MRSCKPEDDNCPAWLGPVERLVGRLVNEGKENGMRISTIESDPGYMRGCYGVRVFLDGAEVTSVFTADEEQRLIVQADLDEEGRLRLNDERTEVRKVIRHGHVRVELPPHLQARLERSKALPPNA